jgi:phospholipase/carboxylesterase
MTLRSAHVLALLALGCSDGRPEQGPRAPQPARPTPAASAALDDIAREPFTAPDDRGWGRAAGYEYLERTLGGGDPAAPMPMLILIHGLGDRPSHDWFAGADAIDTPLRLIMPQAPTPHGDGGFAWFPFRARGNDPDALARGISAASDRLARAIAVLAARRPTRGAPIVAGFSQGGMLSYALALRHPEIVSFSHPISGLLPKPLWPASKPAGTRYPPIAAMHGDADALVPIAGDRELSAHLRALGYDAQLREFPGVAHTITPAMNAHSVELLNATARRLVPR